MGRIIALFYKKYFAGVANVEIELYAPYKQSRKFYGWEQIEEIPLLFTVPPNRRKV